MRKVLMAILSALAVVPASMAQSAASGSILSPNANMKLRQVAVIELPGRPGFDGVAFANGMLLIGHHGAGTVDIFDPIKRRLIAQVTGIDNPRGMASDPDSGLVYIATAGSNSITVVNSRTWKIEGSIGLKHAPESLLLLSHSKSLLVSNPASRSVSLVSTESLGRAQAELATIDVQGHPQQMAWDPLRKQVYVALEDRNSVAVIDPAAPQSPQREIHLSASQPMSLIFEPNSRQLFVTVRYAVLQLDADTGAEISRVPAAAGADTLWYDATSNILYAAAGDGSISIINVSSSRLTAQNEFHADVRGKTLAFDPASRFIYLTGGKEGRSKLVILRHGLPPVPAPETETAMKQP